ncbi:hypothetical protein D5086_028516 [Populus alba]|uniref:Uncharacterized protein n=1 Tax=Populus alba TaxID=43335 RepID=A0ACC4AZA9_POPAL
MGTAHRKRLRKISEKPDLFDQLPDDLVLHILFKLSSSASCPSDFINILITCKRLKQFALDPLVLSRLGVKTFAVKAERWSDSSHQFLKQCANAGNREALYTLGMGHIDALRELGHCLQDGYGVPRDIVQGRRFLVQANAKELALSLRSMLTWKPQQQHVDEQQNLQYACSVMGTPITGCPLLSDFGCNVPAREVHPVNEFLKEWFESRPEMLDHGLRLCSHRGCGRPETRPREFRRCSVCGTVNYCSRGCQALDWKLRHKVECAPMEQWQGVLEDGGDNGIGGMVEIEEGEDVALVG